MNKLKLFVLFGFAHAVAIAVFFYFMFIIAYMGDYTITIDFNAIGEVHIELIVLTVCTMISAFSVMYYMWGFEV